MYTAYFRFYEELNDFLPEENRKVRFSHSFADRGSVKDVIEAMGVPHTEIDMILVNGTSVDFTYIIQNGDDISVYPVFESFDISNVTHLRAQPLRHPRFVADVHLGKLSRYLRMAGFDVNYSNTFQKDEIVEISLNERRTIITRDRHLLKRSIITHGYWVRSENPELQFGEVIRRFHLNSMVKDFSRCLICNSELLRVEKEEIAGLLPPKVRERQQEFKLCPTCERLYWKGTHYEKMLSMIRKYL